MFRSLFFLAVAAGVAMCLTASKAQAWGAYHFGYTHVGPSGVQHWGRTGAVGPYGAYSGGHAGAYGYGGGAYRAGYGAAAGYGGAYRYGGYHYGGMGGYGGYRYGYARRW